MDLELSSPTWGWLVCLSVSAAAPVTVSVPYIFTEAPRYVTAASQAPERFPSGAALQIVENGRRRALLPGFAASADACVSFDGKRVLLSGKQKPGSSWQIWESTIGGGVPRRITTDNRDAITPFYLPAGKIAYSAKASDGFQIEVLPLGGGAPARLTFTPGDHIITDVLRDGRILFEAPHPAGGKAVRDVYSVYADGSGVETIRCDHGRDRRAGRQVSSGDIIFEVSGRLGRFTSAQASEVEGAPARGQFAGPIAELPGGDWLASFRTAATGPFLLHRWKPGAPAPVPVLSSETVNAVQPIAVAARPVPKWHPSSLGDRDGANLLCLNVYTSKQRIPVGSVSSVRVWTGERLLGSAPVAADGSFYVQTPADRPLRFELVDNAGRVVAAEMGSFWARRGEQRVCVGCHAGPERAPDNVAPQVLLHSQEPRKLLSTVGKDDERGK